jgi:hypothetical protein
MLTLSEEIDDPPWSMIEGRIPQLDMNNNDELSLCVLPDESPLLTIGGQVNGRFTVCAQGVEGNRVFHLIDPSRSDREIVVSFPHHTESPISERQLVSVELALQAARWFFEHGEANPALSWMEP